MTGNSLIASDLRVRSRSLLWWCLAVLAVVSMVDAFFPSIAGDESLSGMLDRIPDSMRTMLAPADITTPVGYLALRSYLIFLPAIAMVFGIGRGVATIAGEEEDRTLDLLMAQPISRWSVYRQKTVAVAVSVGVLCLVSALPTIILGPLLMLDLPVTDVLAVTGMLMLLAWVFAAIGLAVGAATGRRGLAMAVAGGAAFVTYLVDGLGQSIDWLDPVRPATPWYWYAPLDALQGQWSGAGAVVLLATALVLTAIGGLLFARRSLR